MVSPWSRGGWVNSQIFDHTSTLLFLEKRFGVREPQISAYRRSICGDLTSAFNFVNPNTEKLPTLAGRSTKVAVDNLTAAQAALPKIPVPATAMLPVQESGTRPSRALPYELHTTARADARAGAVTLALRQQWSEWRGRRLPRVRQAPSGPDPATLCRRSGQALEGTWSASADAGKYDLWVLGPNGYHREFVGNLGEQSPAGGPEIQVCYVLCDPPQVEVKLHNRGAGACTFSMGAQAYRNDGPWTVRVAPGAVGEFTWTLGDSGGWYDFVGCDAAPSFMRRFAGRVESGKDSISYLAMGKVA